MTSIRRSYPQKTSTGNRVRSRARSGVWALQDAKARFSELVRKARSEGPQHVTIHGREEVIVVSADDYRRLAGDRSGEALVTAMQASPHREIEIEPARMSLPVRNVKL